MSIVFIVVVLEISTILVQNLILNLRLLHKKFLAIPAQAIKAQLFGVTKIKIEELTALVSSQNMHGLFCTIRERKRNVNNERNVQIENVQPEPKQTWSMVTTVTALDLTW